jgi:hypothetical protein
MKLLCARLFAVTWVINGGAARTFTLWARSALDAKQKTRKRLANLRYDMATVQVSARRMVREERSRKGSG